MSVTATGAGLTYSWRKGEQRSQWRRYQWQGTSTLTLTNPTAAMQKL